MSRTSSPTTTSATNLNPSSSPILLGKLVNQLRQQNESQYYELQRLRVLLAQQEAMNYSPPPPPPPPSSVYQGPSPELTSTTTTPQLNLTRPLLETSTGSLSPTPSTSRSIKLLEDENSALRAALTKSKTETLIRSIEMRNAAEKLHDSESQGGLPFSPMMSSRSAMQLGRGVKLDQLSIGASSSSIPATALMMPNDPDAQLRGHIPKLICPYNMTHCDQCIEGFKEMLSNKETRILELERQIYELSRGDALARMAEVVKGAVSSEAEELRVLTAEAVALKNENEILLDNYRNMEELLSSKDAEIKNLSLRVAETESSKLQKQRDLERMMALLQDKDVIIESLASRESLFNNEFKTRLVAAEAACRQQIDLERGSLLRELELKDEELNRLKETIHHQAALMGARDTEDALMRQCVDAKDRKLAELHSEVVRLETTLQLNDSSPVLEALQKEVERLRAEIPQREVTAMSLETMCEEIKRLREINFEMRKRLDDNLLTKSPTLNTGGSHHHHHRIMSQQPSISRTTTIGNTTTSDPHKNTAVTVNPTSGVVGGRPSPSNVVVSNTNNNNAESQSLPVGGHKVTFNGVPQIIEDLGAVSDNTDSTNKSTALPYGAHAKSRRGTARPSARARAEETAVQFRETLERRYNAQKHHRGKKRIDVIHLQHPSGEPSGAVVEFKEFSIPGNENCLFYCTLPSHEIMEIGITYANGELAVVGNPSNRLMQGYQIVLLEAFMERLLAYSSNTASAAL